MKDIAKAIFLLAVIYLLLFFLVKTNRQSQVIQDKQSQPVILSDTITNVLYDTVFLVKYNTVKLPVVDSTVYYITDTLTRVDSVFVEVPISIYKFDTTFCNDTTRLDLFIQNKGFNVTLDSLYYRLEYTPTKTKTNYFRDHFRFGLGVGAGFGCFTRKPDIFLGFGFYYCF